jgi:hypothetical protein
VLDPEISGQCRSLLRCHIATPPAGRRHEPMMRKLRRTFSTYTGQPGMMAAHASAEAGRHTRCGCREACASRRQWACGSRRRQDQNGHTLPYACLGSLRPLVARVPVEIFSFGICFATRTKVTEIQNRSAVVDEDSHRAWGTEIGAKKSGGFAAPTLSGHTLASQRPADGRIRSCRRDRARARGSSDRASTSPGTLHPGAPRRTAPPVPCEAVPSRRGRCRDRESQRP